MAFSPIRFVDKDKDKALFFATLRKRVDTYFKENNISTTTINIAKSYIPSEREINKSLKNVKIKKSNEQQISYEDKKKKYISLKILHNIISKRNYLFMLKLFKLLTKKFKKIEHI